LQNLKQRLLHIKERIHQAAVKSGRSPESIRLVAVSKNMPADNVEAAIKAGVTILGENYVQEAREKIKTLSAYPVSWHFIGHLQSNKAKYAVRLFDLIHSVDSFKLAHELNQEARKINKVQPILIQVNIAGESSKSGVDADTAKKLVADINGLENLRINGLMTMPPFFNEPAKVRPYFVSLRNLRDQIQCKIDPATAPNISMSELSMGMTGDFEVAIETGATLVRIGTAIFGERN